MSAGLVLALTATMLDVARPRPAIAAPSAAQQGAEQELERPDEAAALVTARLTGKRVRISGLTSETSEFFALPEGQVEATVAAGVVRVRRDGGWVPVDLTLRALADGSVAPVAHPLEVKVSGVRAASPSGELASVGTGADRVALGWQGALPPPVLEGNKATYRDVLPDTDLVVEATRSGFEQFVVAKSPAAVPHLDEVLVPLSGKRVAAVDEDSTGSLAVEDSAGRKVASVPTPLMWDAQLAPNGESPARVTQIDVTAEQPKTAAQPKTKSKSKASAKSATPAAAGPATLKLTPDAKWLTDPATKYPVTIDPQINKLLTTFDTTVSEKSTADQGGADYLRLGVTTEATPKKSRSFVQWDSTALRGKQITAASAHFYNWYSTTCSQTPWEIWTTDPANADTRWANQPKWLTKEATSTQTKGLNTTCGDGWVAIDAKNFFQRAATGNANRAHMGIRAANEADKSQWKEFRSRNADNTAQVPYAKVTYNSYPTIGARSTDPSVPCVAGANRPYINTETPQLKAMVSDPDGSKVKASFEWYAIDPSGQITRIGGTTTGLAASGSTLTATIPAGALTNNRSYAWRVMANDGSVDSAWSSFCDFKVDKDAPGVAPAVTSTAYPANTWGGAADKAGDFTFNAAGVGDVAAFEYGLDVNPPTQRVNAANVGGTATANVTPGSDGPHTLFVRSVDRAGNRSPVAKYEFQVGAGAVTKPANGDLIAGMTTLEGAGKSDAAGVEYQWRRGDADGWQGVPAAHVALTEGGGAVAWPLPATGGKPARLNWDVARTLNDAEAGPDPLDGPVQVRAVFTGAGAGTSSTVKFNFDRDRASAASQEIGPGSVNLLTGNFTVSDADVSVDAFGSDLTLSRTYASRQAGKVDAMFGPGWTSAVVVDEAASPYTALTVTGSLVQVGLPEGDSVGFARDRTTATGATFESELGAEDLTLTYTSAGDRYTLKNVDGTVVTFTRSGDTPAGQYLPTTVDLPGSGQSTTLSWEKATVDGATVMRPTRMLAPAPAGVDCSNGVVKGCRALNFHYATATTASGAEAGQFGDYTNRLREVTFTAFDPAADKMATVALARYDYDNTGRLRSVWDPRLDYDNGKHLADTYRYDSAGGVLSELRPAGQEPWQFAYSPIPGDPGVGRLHQVKRSALAAGTAVYSLAYQVPTIGNGAPYTLSAELTRRWGQTVHPVEATAVFGPDQIPDGNLSEGKLPSSYERADITYVDANGREVNTAAPGDYLTATWYDKWGNIVRELGAGNLRRALDAAGNDSAEQEAQAAYELSTLNVYSADGQQLRDTYGPEHEVVTPGPWLRGRQHTATRYDEGAPTDGGPFNLPTTVTTSLSFTDDRGTQEIEPRVTKTGYDWKLRQPTSTTVGPDWPNLTTRTRYNEAGLVVATTAPRGGNSEDTPSTRKTIYYQAGTGSGRGECDNKPHWANLPCRVESGGQPDSGPALPSTVITYDMFNQPVTEVEKAGDTVLRTQRISYDGAGRPQVTAVTGLGKPVPVERNVYDPATGVLVRTQSVVDGTVTAEVVREHDALGRQVGYTDADGNRSTTGYDLLGRVVSTSNGKGSRSYGFDAGNERRGLLTSITDSLAGGTFTARHDADGAVVAETWPNGMTVTHEYDETGTERAINYERPGCGRDDCSVYYDIARNNVHGQKRWTDDPFTTQVFSYDPAGRMFYTTVTGRGDGICDIRKYDLDAASNRTKKHTYRSDSSDCLVENPTGSTSYTYDSADRITGGYTYDALGRTTVLPAADTANPDGGDVTIDYHVTDLVKSITQAGRTTSYTLDVTGERVRSWTDTAAGAVTRTHHYDDDTDSPAWTDEGNNTYTTAVSSVSGMAGIAGNNGIDWKLSNLHGDLVATIHAADAGISGTHGTDEYGVPNDAGNVGTQRYGWLGANQRAADAPAGMTLMGVRLYNGVTGRFLSVDPVYGGSANPYEYCHADPVNCYDLDGKRAGWLRPLGTLLGKYVVRPLFRAGMRAQGFTIGLGLRAAAKTVRAARWVKSIPSRTSYKGGSLRYNGEKYGWRAGYDRKVHPFKWVGNRRHIQINAWKKGRANKGRGIVIRIPLPW